MADITDYIGNAARFPVLRNWNYFNHAGIAPAPRAVADALRLFADQSEAGAYLDTDWWPHMERVRLAAATFVNAEKAEIALVKNTSEGISTVAAAIELSPGDRIVTANVEYSANVYPWMETARRTGAELVMVAEETDENGRRQVPIEKVLEAVAHPKTKVLTLSHVEYASGQRFDLARLGTACRDRGILFNVDGIQSLGAVPVDVVAMRIDCLSACGHKWMFGPTGAGLLYVRQAWQDRLRPVLVGATTVVDWQDFGKYNYTLRPDAGRYESGSANLPGLFGWHAALEMFNEVGMGPISERLKALTDQVIVGLELKGYKIVSPRDNDAWSGMVCFTSDRHDHDALVASLRKDHRTEILVREKRLRISPHFYNTEQQMTDFLAALPSH